MLGRMLAAASRRVAESDVNDFAELAKVERYVGYAMNLAVAGLRRSGYTWDEIGAAAGTTRQAAHQRWARKVEAA